MSLSTLRLGAGIVAAVLLVVSLAGVLWLDKLHDRFAHTVTERHLRTELTHSVNSEFDAMTRAVFASLVVEDNAGVKQELERINQGKAKVSDLLEALDKSFAAENDESKRRLQAVHDRTSSYLVSLIRFTRMLAAERRDDARTVLTSALKSQLEDASYEMLALSADQTRLLQRDEVEGIAAYKQARNIVLLVFGLAVAMSVLVAILVARRISLKEAVKLASLVAAGDLTSRIVAKGDRETEKLMAALRRMTASLTRIVTDVRTGSDTVAAASKDLVGATSNLAQRTEEHASALEESASSLEQLTATVKQTADNANQASELALGASSTASKGGEVMAKVVEMMNSIHHSAKKATDIIGVINGIAFQTNILALNAAVEAARAGDHGRGFSVVASEVRALAQRSAVAAKEIQALLGDSASQVDAGARLVTEAGHTMSDIVAKVRKVTELVTDISTAAREQSSGIDQVNQALAQMERVIQENTALVQGAGSVAESLDAQARALTEAVRLFRLDHAPAPVERQVEERPAAAVRLHPATAVIAAAGSR